MTFDEWWTTVTELEPDSTAEISGVRTGWRPLRIHPSANAQAVPFTRIHLLRVLESRTPFSITFSAPQYQIPLNTDNYMSSPRPDVESQDIEFSPSRSLPPLPGSQSTTPQKSISAPSNTSIIRTIRNLTKKLDELEEEDELRVACSVSEAPTLSPSILRVDSGKVSLDVGDISRETLLRPRSSNYIHQECIYPDTSQGSPITVALLEDQGSTTSELTDPTPPRPTPGSPIGGRKRLSRNCPSPLILHASPSLSPSMHLGSSPRSETEMEAPMRYDAYYKGRSESPTFSSLKSRPTSIKSVPTPRSCSELEAPMRYELYHKLMPVSDSEPMNADAHLKSFDPAIFPNHSYHSDPQYHAHLRERLVNFQREESGSASESFAEYHSYKPRAEEPPSDLFFWRSLVDLMKDDESIASAKTAPFSASVSPRSTKSDPTPTKSANKIRLGSPSVSATSTSDLPNRFAHLKAVAPPSSEGSNPRYRESPFLDRVIADDTPRDSVSHPSQSHPAGSSQPPQILRRKSTPFEEEACEAEDPLPPPLFNHQDQEQTRQVLQITPKTSFEEEDLDSQRPSVVVISSARATPSSPAKA